ncbi:M16 family metallopeptidase [Alteromonas gilva]|uniref:Pitrilysin family protein n=1 Tax=Alteromonas gilva TaxID=2987522 RepID=A0ABT5L5N7_9ALTE|nr:pitrilysin family protein [Alteromonas gilva]MDC8831681.1 pitrilysin family protein [Alteromonas gilva]
MKLQKALIASLLLTLWGCSEPPTPQQTAQPQPASPAASELRVDYETYTLENGLTVVLHVDKSDPIVAMATVVHVGSNREKPGRTGFAHFFEHMSFNDSENVPKGANRKMIPELGGTRNGGTWSDGTIYYEVVPKDAFDKLLWIDSDRLGYMINTVDQGTLEREKQVVKNEKRQRVDNRPYGHMDHVVRKALYPQGHPYNWTVIGDLADLQAATLDDVREFYNQFYMPSNATLVIAGDIDIQQTKQKVERWFGEIKAGEPSAPLEPQPVTLEADKKLYHLDNFAKLPLVRLTYPTVEQYSKDAYALDALARLLSNGKNAVLYKTLVEELKLAPSPNAWSSTDEVAGSFTINVQANADVQLDNVYAGIQQALDDFAKNGFTDAQLQTIKAEQETAFYYSIESILDKALQLGIYNEYAGSPGFIEQDIANISAVTRDDVMRVFKQYIYQQPAVIASFVPKDQPELIVTGSAKAPVVEEEIVPGQEPEFEEKPVEYTKTPTQHDRSEPPLSELPTLSTPDIWRNTLANGMEVIGITTTELPVVNFALTIDGGQWLDPAGKTGTALLMAQMLNEGTATKTPQELEQAIGQLGAQLSVAANRDAITLSGRVLARHYPALMELAAEMLLAPRWDENEFNRLKSTRLTRIKQSEGNAARIASNVFSHLLYGDNHVAGVPMGGTKESVEAITLDDVKAYYDEVISPKQATLHVVGALAPEAVTAAANALSQWQGSAITLPAQPAVTAVTQPTVYFVDVPDAKQSVIYVGKTVLPASDPDFYAIDFANERLGGGMSARLGQTLRIQKGYTYGAYSYLPEARYQVPFIAASQVRTNVTLESLQIFKELIGQYQPTYQQDDLDVAKNMVIKANSRRFETLNSLLDMLQNISRFDLAEDYIAQQQGFVQSATLEEIHRVINTYLNEQQMIYLVVGDAATQLERIEKLGYGKPVVLDIYGNKLH